MARRTTEQQILDLQAKIQSIQARAERKKVKANPAVKFMAMGLRSIDKALNSTDDQVLKKALDEARATVASCLALTGVKKGLGQRTLTPRAPAGARSGASSTENGAHAAQLDANDLIAFLRTNPGSSSETITKQFATDAATLRGAMRTLLDQGKVTTKGQKRGTRYFVGV